MKYASHPETFISVICWKVLGENKGYKLVLPKLTTTPNSAEALEAVKMLVDKDVKIIAHNANFERHILNFKLEGFLKELGIKDNTVFKPDKFICTLTLSNLFGGPSSLEEAGKYFNLNFKKDEFGAKVMKSIYKLKVSPRNKTTKVLGIGAYLINIKDDLYAKGGPEIYDIMAKYCAKDVMATESLYSKLLTRVPQLGSFKKHALDGVKLTRQINNNGMKLDMESLRKLNLCKDAIFEALDASTVKHFGIDSGGKKTKILDHLKGLGHKIKSMGEKDIINLIEICDDPKVKKGLEERVKYNKTSLNKITKALNSNYDGAIYDSFKYCGASTTGRWASYGMQLQNIPRPVHPLLNVVKFLGLDDEAIVKAALEDPNLVVSSLRAILVPREGNRFFISDFDQIELRWSLIKAGYNDITMAQVRGQDLYADMGYNIFKHFGKTREDITKGSFGRYIGKQAMLAAQYGVGPQGFAFQVQRTSGKELDEQVARYAVSEFRKKFDKVCALWSKYDREIRKHIGREYKVKLVTGRYLNYGKLSERQVKDLKNGHMKKQICFFNPEKKKYVPIYGSKVYQNVVQAECRDIMLIKANAFSKTKLGSKIVSLVHDELICEVPESLSRGEVDKVWKAAGKEEIEEIFKGLPVTVDSKIASRFFK